MTAALGTTPPAGAHGPLASGGAGPTPPATGASRHAPMEETWGAMAVTHGITPVRATAPAAATAEPAAAADRRPANATRPAATLLEEP